MRATNNATVPTIATSNLPISHNYSLFWDCCVLLVEEEALKSTLQQLMSRRMSLYEANNMEEVAVNKQQLIFVAINKAVGSGTGHHLFLFLFLADWI